MDNPDAGELIAAYQYYGKEIPKGLIPPELQDVEQFYWSAFWDLSGDRQAGGPLPWTAIRHYFQVEGFGDFFSFKRILKDMDSAYLTAKNPKK